MDNNNCAATDYTLGSLLPNVLQLNLLFNRKCSCYEDLIHVSECYAMVFFFFLFHISLFTLYLAAKEAPGNQLFLRLTGGSVFEKTSNKKIGSFNYALFYITQGRSQAENYVAPYII